jgi:hypothetical protein
MENSIKDAAKKLFDENVKSGKHASAYRHIVAEAIVKRQAVEDTVKSAWSDSVNGPAILGLALLVGVDSACDEYSLSESNRLALEYSVKAINEADRKVDIARAYVDAENIRRKQRSKF